MAEWVLWYLGPPPKGHSLDREDNDSHYERFNLRWATKQVQIDNRRQYRRSPQGERLRYLTKERPDVVYETLRMWIKQGLTDDQIRRRKRGSS